VNKETKEKAQGQGPRISCVVPCLNAESYLASALDSLVAAAGPRDEIIAVYDHSTDKTLQLLEAYAPKLRIITRHAAVPRGAAAALNDGFAAATGDVLCWLGADDYVFPWAFDTVRAVFGKYQEVQWLTSTQPCVIRGASVTCEPLGGLSRDHFLDGFAVPGRRGARWIQQESTFWRRDLWVAAGGALRSDLKFAFDLHLWARFFALAPIYGVDSLLAAFRYREGQLSSQVDKLLPEAAQVLQEARLECGWRRSAMRELLHYAGWKRSSAIRGLALRIAPYSWGVARFGPATPSSPSLRRERFWIY